MLQRPQNRIISVKTEAGFPVDVPVQLAAGFVALRRPAQLRAVGRAQGQSRAQPQAGDDQHQTDHARLAQKRIRLRNSIYSIRGRRPTFGTEYLELQICSFLLR